MMWFVGLWENLNILWTANKMILEGNSFEMLHRHQIEPMFCLNEAEAFYVKYFSNRQEITQSKIGRN